MSLQELVTLGVIVGVVLCMTTTRFRPAFIMLGALTILVSCGILAADQALSGFANEGVATIAALFVLAAGMRETGSISMIADRLLGRPASLLGAQIRVMLPVAMMSAFINNTPLVAMLMPQVSDWSKGLGLSTSKLMLPLSYASIMGGACTLIGTSTNLVVNGWLIEETQLEPLGMFESAAIGIPICVACFLYMLTVGQLLLPDRRPPIDRDDDPREYTVEMLVERNSPIAGKTIEQAGLRQLPGLYLIEVGRNGQVLPAVSSNVVLKEQDRLVLAGVVESVVDVQRIRGLQPATNQVYKLDEPRTNRTFVEAVVSDSCPLVGQTIREGKFRSRYNAAVIALARNGERVQGKLGDIRLRAGDTLLLEARRSFAAQQRNSRDFYLVSSVDGVTPPNHDRAPIALTILVATILAVTVGGIPMFTAALLSAGFMIMTRCLRGSTAMAAVNIQVLLVTAAAIGVGKAISETGLDRTLANLLLDYSGHGPYNALAATFIITMALACSVTAKAAVVIVLPICQVASTQMGLSPMPFVMTVLIAAATTVATPIGYPTNLMVMGPGGYRSQDYFLVGGPLTLLVGLMSVLLIPLYWPFLPA